MVILFICQTAELSEQRVALFRPECLHLIKIAR